MESSIFNKQGIIQAESNVFWTMQFTRNISMDNEQYIPKAVTQRSTGKLYGQLCNIYQDKEGIQRKKHIILKYSRKV